MITLQPTFNF